MPLSEVYGGQLLVPDGEPTTLQGALARAAELAPEKGIRYLRAGRADDVQSYPELLAEAEVVLGGLRAAGLEPGDAVLFQFDGQRDFTTAFWACVLGGFVPTPVAVAPTYTQHHPAHRALHHAWLLLGRPVVLTDDATRPGLEQLRRLWGGQGEGLRILGGGGELGGRRRDTRWYAAGAGDPVVHLLTRGTGSGRAKCAVHTNSSVAARTWAAVQARGYRGDDVSLVWMPPEQQSMIFYGVRDVFLRCQQVSARIDDFLDDPLRWLDWMDRCGATNTWAPDFAYALVTTHADELAGRAWDLSRVREFVNAGEPVCAATSQRFLELLAPHGLAADAVAPCWGMSETCSGVTYSLRHREDRATGGVVVAPSSFGGPLRYVDAAGPRGGAADDGVELAMAGGPLPGVGIRVVDEAGEVLPQDRVGELQVRGAALMSGYWGEAASDPGARAVSEAGPGTGTRGAARAGEGAADDGWLRTGDLAFVHDSSLVVAGRTEARRGPCVVFTEEWSEEHVAVDGGVPGGTGVAGVLVQVCPGAEFAVAGDGRFRVVPGETEHIRRVFALTAARHGPVASVVFRWPGEFAGITALLHVLGELPYPCRFDGSGRGPAVFEDVESNSAADFRTAEGAGADSGTGSGGGPLRTVPAQVAAART
ncbi:AMP-binding protein [Streptomyces sp. NPDC059009]|uniref:AMP-binding protein n=1 Tax=Streptomyces sp. NPDC059009 TaxID=3346694 RepID=UPI0036BD0ADA